jgi:putative DNA-invertase from lambdoid prophage Rac
MERAVALLRASTDHQDLDHQRQAAFAWAARQDPPVALELREEPATSGAAKSRPILDALLEDARRGHFDVLVVGALDRVGRDVVRIVLALDELQAAGVRVVSLREGLDFGGPMGRAMGALLGAIAEIERAAIRERVRSGLRAARARGTQLGRPGLEWRAEELAEVRRLVADGRSIREIGRDGLVKVFLRGGPAVAPSEAAIRKALRATSA